MNYDPYPPQSTAVPAGDGIWTIEGPSVPYRVGPFTVPCPTRSTVLSDPEGGLWVHSPVRFSNELLRALQTIGPVRGLIAPNTFHHLYLAQWCEAVPDATCIVAPRLEAKLSGLDPARLASAEGHSQLAGWLDVELIDGGAWCELIFHHRSSRTLVVTDLIQNFELERVNGLIPRVLLWLTGAGRGPVLSSELLALAFFAGRYTSVRRGMTAFNAHFPERMLIAHGAQPEGHEWPRLTGL